eukprot:15223-Chlamydomonas_euryale.AAC.2
MLRQGTLATSATAEPSHPQNVQVYREGPPATSLVLLGTGKPRPTGQAAISGRMTKATRLAKPHCWQNYTTGSPCGWQNHEAGKTARLAVRTAG